MLYDVLLTFEALEASLVSLGEDVNNLGQGSFHALLRKRNVTLLLLYVCLIYSEMLLRVAEGVLMLLVARLLLDLSFALEDRVSVDIVERVRMVAAEHD